MEMKVTFPGNLAVEANIDGYTIRSGQPKTEGGDDSAPSPFLLFLASIATCAGFFAFSFCQGRDISTEGLELNVIYERDPRSHKLESAKLHLTLPQGFPEKYHKAIIRAMDQCSVKKTLFDPPDFEITIG